MAATKLFIKIFLLIWAATVFFQVGAPAQNLNQIGVTLLRATTTNLDGSGIGVAQPEASAPTFEVNPSVVGQPASLFTYYSSTGTATVFPNDVGTESTHADDVGNIFYGLPGGVATNVAHVDNFDADYFYTNYVVRDLQALNDLVVNQSFIFTGTNGGHASVSDQQEVDSNYDNFSAQHNTIFVSGAGNGGPVNPPGTCYNGLGIAAYDGSSSIGPTPDNGRCKPDITAPATATSYSTPQVSGAAVLLRQAALRGDGGNDTNSAFDLRTIKALLLNGAVKPVDWTNSASSPLDARYGAGILNVFNSYEQLAGGKNNFISATTVSVGDAHLPNGASGTISNLSGWDFETISSTAGGLFSTATDGVKHYFFNVSNNFPNAVFSATATLVWNRQQNKSDINNLDLFLYNCANSNLVACSTSLVDNVEQIFLPQLATGRYDLQILKHGGSFVSASETYALAWEFFSQTLNAEKIGTNIALTFPIYPDGFLVEATTNLLPPIVWSTTDLPSPILTNGENYILLNATNPSELFRLHRP